MVVGPLGTTTGVVATALVGVLGVPTVGVAVGVPPACGVITVPVVIACGVTGVPPFAIVVCAAAVCFANSSIIAIGFSAEGSGEMNSPAGIDVGVATGAADNDCVQAAINTVDITKVKIISKPRLLFLIDSPLSTCSGGDGST